MASKKKTKAKKAPQKPATKAKATARFVTPAMHKKNVAIHAKMVDTALTQLKQHGITSKHACPLEFFFAANANANAQALAEMLAVHEYDVTVVRSGKKFMVAGVTTPIPMSPVALRDWSRDMVALGFEFDSLFDGWSLTEDALSQPR